MLKYLIVAGLRINILYITVFPIFSCTSLKMKFIMKMIKTVVNVLQIEKHVHTYCS